MVCTCIFTDPMKSFTQEGVRKGQRQGRRNEGEKGRTIERRRTRDG